jgi:hypothetical protein
MSSSPEVLQPSMLQLRTIDPAAISILQDYKAGMSF